MLRSLVDGFRRSAAKRGVVRTLGVGVAKVADRARWLGRQARVAVFDLRYGVETRGYGPALELATAPVYEPTTPERFARVVRELRVDPAQFTFLDLGCGKGLTLLLAARLGFRRVVGVELSPRLAAIARRNVARAGVAAEVVQGDALAYELPAEPLVLYLYSAFPEEHMRRLAATVERSLREHPRPLRIAYLVPKHASALDAIPLERMAADPRWIVYASRS
jgi:SAM-dependent methyltransferase